MKMFDMFFIIASCEKYILLLQEKVFLLQSGVVDVHHNKVIICVIYNENFFTFTCRNKIIKMKLNEFIGSNPKFEKIDE